MQSKSIYWCVTGTGCTSSKSEDIIKNLRKLIEEKNIENVRVIQTGCFGLCAKGPIVIIRPEDVFYSNVKPEDTEEIIDTHIVNRRTCRKITLQRCKWKASKKTR